MKPIKLIKLLAAFSLILLLFVLGVYCGITIAQKVSGIEQSQIPQKPKKKIVDKARPIIVAVIDTGIASHLKYKVGCKYGHRDFTNEGLEDVHGHGTAIASAIDQYVKNLPFFDINNISKIDTVKANYCQVFIKYFHNDKVSTNTNLTLEKALRWAIDIEVDYINYSGGGTYFSVNEELLVKEALDKGIKIIAAAGNEACELNGECYKYFKDAKGQPVLDKNGRPAKIKASNKYYPAMLDERIYVVGNLDLTMERAPSSNYGDVVHYWEIGSQVLSHSIVEDEYVKSTGTSMAAAIKTGKLVREMLLQRR